MLVLSRSLQNVPIMSLQNGSKLGVSGDPVIDPRKLQIAAYYATGPRIHLRSVIHTNDIREFGPLGLIVDSSERLMELDESLVRLNEVIRLNFSLIGKPVIDEHKRKLGKVVEYALETESYLIQKIHVGQSVIKNLTASSLIIDRKQIVELNDRVIVVRSGAVKDSPGLMQAINPFRRARSLSPASESVRHRD